MKNQVIRQCRILTFLSIIILLLVHFPVVVLSKSVEGGDIVTQSGILTGNNKMAMVIAAVGAIAISCITSAYALAKIGSAALGAMSEKPEIGARAVIFLGLAEGIAIYGLIVAIMILNKI